MTLDQPNVGDNLRLVQLDRVLLALAALRFMKWIENGTAIVREPGLAIWLRGLEKPEERT